MQKRKSVFPTFLVFFILVLFIFILASVGFLKGLTGFFEEASVPLQRSIFDTFHNDDLGEVSKLRDENSKLAHQIVDQKEIERENQALSDQFQTTHPSPRTLLPSRVIGVDVDIIRIDKGNSDNIKKGEVVVVNDNLVGKIDKVSEHLSIVKLITNSDISFTAQTLKTQSPGILKGQTARIVLENVVLSDHLEKDDLVVTKGEGDPNGSGFPPNLVVGKISFVNKKASSLFQSAEVKSLLDFGRLSMVFVKISN